MKKKKNPDQDYSFFTNFLNDAAMHVCKNRLTAHICINQLYGISSLYIQYGYIHYHILFFSWSLFQLSAFQNSISNVNILIPSINSNLKNPKEIDAKSKVIIVQFQKSSNPTTHPGKYWNCKTQNKQTNQTKLSRWQVKFNTFQIVVEQIEDSLHGRHPQWKIN